MVPGLTEEVEGVTTRRSPRVGRLLDYAQPGVLISLFQKNLKVVSTIFNGHIYKTELCSFFCFMLDYFLSFGNLFLPYFAILMVVKTVSK